MSNNNQFKSKDTFQRMNYLLQLCRITNENGPKHLANFYSHNTIGLSKKAVLRLDSDIKKTICKTCHQYLVPGDTCSVRIRNKTVVYKCLLCFKQKRYPSNPDYCTWAKNPEANHQILNCKNKTTAENK